jgi:copper transport protein
VKRALALALALLALAPAGAHAHAELVSTSPERGARVDGSPERVSFRFNEPVEASFGAVRVFDASGERVDDGTLSRPGGDAEAVSTALGRLPDGVYTATYRVVSADSHPVAGGFVFTVRAGGPASGASVAALIEEGESGPVTSVAFGAVRALSYVSIALAVGGAAFLAFVWLPGPRSDASGAFARRAWRVAAATLVLGLLTAALGIVLQGANAAGISFWSALRPEVVGDVLDTRFGTVWGLRVLAWLLLGALAVPLVRRWPSPALTAAAALLLGFLVVSPGLAGHAGTTDPVALVLTANSGHVLAMSVWVGGLVALLAVLPAATRQLAPPERAGLLAGCVRRFSPLALTSVALLLATGVLQSIVHLEALSDLLDSAFGRAILIKGVLIVVLVGLGAVNLRRSRPRLEQAAVRGAAPGAAGRLLRRTVAAEVALVAVALAVTAALTAYPPPRALAAGPYSTSTDLGEARLELTVDPAAAGSNEIHMYLFDERTGAQYDRPREVSVRLRLPSKGIGPLEPRVDKAGPGHWVARRALISPAGDWTLQVRALITEFEETRAVVEVPVE